MLASVPTAHCCNLAAGSAADKQGAFQQPAARPAKGRQRVPPSGSLLRHQSSSNSLNAAALQRGTANSQPLLQVELPMPAKQQRCGQVL